MSAFPPDMQLWPEGVAPLLNVDNRFEGTINGVPFRCEVKGDFAVIGFIDPKTGEQKRVFQPHFNFLGLVLAGMQLATGQPLTSDMIGLTPKLDGD